MLLIILAVASFVCAGLAYLPNLGWISIFGFCLGIMLWVLARKMRQTAQKRSFLTVCMALGIISSFVNLWGVAVVFFLSSLLSGGPVVM